MHKKVNYCNTLCILVGLLYVAAFVQSDIDTVKTGSARGSVDFQVYYLAGLNALRGRSGQLYYPPAGGWNVDPQQRIVPRGTSWASEAKTFGFVDIRHYLYPPAFALAFSPLSRLPPRRAEIVWHLLNLGLLLAAIAIVLRILQVEPLLPAFLLACVGATSFFPFAKTQSGGQVGTLVLFLWTAGAWFASRQKSFLSALCFVLGTLTKVTPVLAIGLFLVRRQWRWLAYFLGLLASCTALSVAFLGWEPYYIFLSKVLPSMSCGMPLPENQSFFSMAQMLAAGRAATWSDMFLFPVHPWACTVAKLMTVVAYGTFLAFLLLVRRKPDLLWFEVSFLIPISVVFSPVSWRHNYVLLLLPLLILWSIPQIVGRRPYLLAISTLLIGTQLSDHLSSTGLGLGSQVLATGLRPLGALIVVAIGLEYYRTTSAMPEKNDPWIPLCP